MYLTREKVEELAWNNAETITAEMLSDYDGIADNAFMDAKMKYLEIPDTITYIGDCAFKRCTNLYANKKRTSFSEPKIDYLTIPDSVEHIGIGAFKSCHSLEHVYLLCDLDEIPQELFSTCQILKTVNIDEDDTSRNTVNIPDNVETIGNEAFEYCEAITKVIIPEGVEYIGDEVFAGCVRLNKITNAPYVDVSHLPSSVEHIGLRSFAGCAALTALHLPNELAEIGDLSFDGCGFTGTVSNSTILAFVPREIEGVYTVGGTITTIAGGALKDCKKITGVVLPNTLTTIGKSAFEGCNKIKKINIPTSVTYIGNHAFHGLTVLAKKFNQKLTNEKIIAYKGFDYVDGTIKCNGFDYKGTGWGFNYEGDPILCKQGFHACMSPLDVFSYYYGDLSKIKIHLVWLFQVVNERWDDTKIVADRIEIKEELSLQDITNLIVV